MNGLDYEKDGHQEWPECDTCTQWQLGPQHDMQGNNWSKVMCCWHGAYRPSFWTGLRVTHPHKMHGGAPDWCPRRLKNHQCTCTCCPECVTLHEANSSHE